MAELGAFALRSDTELLLKSRRVVPGRLLEAGFAFDHARWPEAAGDLVRRACAAGAASPCEPPGLLRTTGAASPFRVAWPVRTRSPAFKGSGAPPPREP